MSDESAVTTTSFANTDPGLPSPASIALAHAIIRTKPPDATIDEYIDRLSNSFLYAETPKTARDPVAGFSSTSYWKSECLRAQAQKLETEIEVQQLREELDLIRLDGPSGKGRHTAGDRLTTKANTQTKRGADRSRNLPSTKPTVEPEISVELTGDPDIDGLLRHMRILYTHNANENIDVGSLYIRLGSACCCLNKLASRPNELAPRIAPICQCLYRSLASISDMSLAKQVCVRLVRVFATTLQDLYQEGVDEVARKDREEQNRAKNHKPNSKAVKSTAIEDDKRAKMYRANLVKIMSCMIGTIDLNHTAHIWLYEGLASLLLDHIGSELSYLIFIDPADPGPGLLPVSGLLDDPDVSPDAAIAAAELNAPSFVALLRCLLSKVRAKGKRSSTARILARSHMGTTGDDERGKFLRTIEKRLQNTLLSGMFGTEDEEFRDCLWRPDEPDDLELQEAAALEEEERGEGDHAGGSKKDWFIAQMWELLGWDILADSFSTVPVH
ncbi:uncharacterized protein AB675_1385 [Cyphellophora attinorum]|uniref:Uncharacterized protein n=1 Tax=Cyphellophora attinorum TaxID=1664694 RepID=A0A0N1NVP7_9EURO|nr:uncharacterized protein AB675_1385 [Phialophora attinorum]KPI35136.1 hypothetical protein AB675_1385 [Phialophora attinorum]